MSLKNTIEIICLKCNTIIFSCYSGEFVSCNCGSCYIDQTDYYCRIGGNADTFEYLTEFKEDND